MKSPRFSQTIARRAATRTRFIIPVLALGSALLSGQSSFAATATWNNITGNADFNTGTNWTGGTGPGGIPGSADTAAFFGAAVSSPDVSAPDSILGLNFATTDAIGYTVSSANSSALTLLSTATTGATVAVNGANTTGSNTISAPLVFGAAAGTTQVVQVALGGTLNITGNLSNTNALTFLQIGNSALGTVSLAGTSTGLTAPVKLNGGTLVLGNNTSLGSGSFTFGTNCTIQSSDTGTRTISNVLGAFSGSNPTYVFGTASTGDLIFNNTTSAGIGGANARVFTVNNATTTISAPLVTTSTGGGLKKSGSGNLILLGANAYAGSATVYGVGTTITAGTLTIGNGTGGASLPTTTSLNNAGALVFNNAAADASTTTGSASSTGTITKSGAGSVTINSPTFNAATTSGSPTINVSATAGLLIGSTVTGAGIPTGATITAIGTPVGSVTPVTISINATATTATTTALNFGSSYTGAITVSNGTLSLGGVGAVISGASTITLSNGTTIGYSNPDQTFLNRINGSGTASNPVSAVVGFGTGFAGAATLDFTNLPNVTLGATSNGTLSSGTITPANNLYRIGGGTGTLTINGALLSGASNNLEVNGSIIVGTNNAAYGGSTTINSGGNLRATQNARIPSATAMIVNSGGRLDLGNTDAGTTTTVASLAGAGLVTNTISTSSNKILAVTGSTSTIFSGTIEDRNSVSATSTTALTRGGTGTLTLTGTNTYTGGTSVTGGTLLVNGPNNGGGAVSIAGGTLGGSSSLAGPVTLTTGTITGGAAGSVGMLTLTSNAALNGGTYQADSSGSTIDRLILTSGGTLTLAGVTLTINGSLDGTTTYDIASYGNGLETGTFAFNNVPANYTISYGATEIDLVPVPEPSTWVGCAFLIVGVSWQYRRRRAGAVA